MPKNLSRTNACLSEEPEDGCRYGTISTLGADNLSNSVYSMQLSGLAGEVIGYDTFEDAAQAVILNQADAFSCPVAFPGIGKFLYNESLKTVAAIIERIPDIVLVSKTMHPENDPQVLFQHPATTHLNRELEIYPKEIVLVGSTPEACRKLTEYQGDCEAITNELAAAYYGVKIKKRLRMDMTMVFVIFQKR